MKRISTLFIAVAVLSLAVPALAGEGYACHASAQECLDKLAQKAATMGYEGLDGDYDKEAHVWTVTAVHADSPALEAGFEAGDVIFGANDIAFAEFDKASWKKFEEHQVVGATVTYNVMRDGHKKSFTVTLIEMPETEVAELVGKHMVAHAQVAQAAGE